VASRDKVEWSLLFLGHLDEFARLAWYLVANDKLVENVILRTMSRLDEFPFDGSVPDLAYNQARQILIQQSIEVVELDREDEFVPMPPTLVELPNLVRLAFMLKLILRSPEGEVAKFLRVTPDRVGELVSVCDRQLESAFATLPAHGLLRRLIIAGRYHEFHSAQSR
jgi:hypothetical protein